MPDPELVTCESLAAIVVHARKIGIVPINLSGHKPTQQPKALCNVKVALDTRRPLTAVTCATCISHMGDQAT